MKKNSKKKNISIFLLLKIILDRLFKQKICNTKKTFKAILQTYQRYENLNFGKKNSVVLD